MKSKKIISLLTVLTAFAVTVSSCKKDNGITANAVTEEEAAEVISLAVSGNTEAFSDQVTEAAIAANVYGSTCSYNKDTAVTRTNTAGAYTWNYMFNWNRAVVCTSGVPNTFNANYKMKGSYDAPKMSSNDSAVASLAVTNLISGSQYTYNGSYTRSGSQVSKILNKNTFTSKIILNLSNVKVNKITGMIDSGTATISIAGATTSGNSFNYTGGIIFNGSKNASITLSSGRVYIVSW
jgi:hypothetical protein